MIYAELSIVVLLMLLNGVFAMSELAIVSAKKVHLRKLADEGNKAAQIAIDFADDTGRFLPAVQIGITLIGILSGAFSGATLADYLIDPLTSLGIAQERAELVAVTFVVVIVTYLTLIIGELVPKELALRNPEKMALFVAPIIFGLSRLTWPVVALLNASSRFMLWAIRAGDKPASTVTQEEVAAMIAEGADFGIFGEKEQEMLDGVMLLADKPVRAFMRPRGEVITLQSNATLDDFKQMSSTHNYTRYPVRDATEPDHILGAILTKDVLHAVLHGESFSVQKLIQPIPAFPEHSDALLVLEHLRDAPVDMAVVIDEHGSFDGIVTLADLISIITGRLYEHGVDSSEEITERGDGSWLMDGSTLIDHAFDAINLNLRDQVVHEHYHTLAGFMLHHFRTIPKAGQGFIAYGFRFEVMDMDGYRIDKVLIERTPVADE